MRHRKYNDMKVCFETFGCRLNRAEALQREAEYLAKGWTLTDKHAEADLFIVRGCSVTRHAQSECEKLIDHLKRRYPLKTILIEGCLKNTLNSQKPAQGLPPSSAALPTRTARAYLKVQDGCSGKCTFCIVPQFRGTSRSEPFDEVVDRAKRFIDAGYHEIVVTGCNLSLYAHDGKRLPELVDTLASLSDDCRIRIGSLEPGDCALATVDVMSAHVNICRFLHIPIQSGANRLLTAMRRPYLITHIDALVQKALQTMPLIGLGCDLMSGYPGETEIDHLASKGLVKRLPFSNFHVFPYSPRPDTIAAGLPGALPTELRHARAHELGDVGRELRAKFAKKFIGKDVEMILEDEKKLTGWTGEYFACTITNSNRAQSLKRKDLVRVHVMDAHNARLSAILI